MSILDRPNDRKHEKQKTAVFHMSLLLYNGVFGPCVDELKKFLQNFKFSRMKNLLNLIGQWGITQIWTDKLENEQRIRSTPVTGTTDRKTGKAITRQTMFAERLGEKEIYFSKGGILGLIKRLIKSWQMLLFLKPTRQLSFRIACQVCQLSLARFANCSCIGQFVDNAGKVSA